VLKSAQFGRRFAAKERRGRKEGENAENAEEDWEDANFTNFRECGLGTGTKFNSSKRRKRRRNCRVESCAVMNLVFMRTII
jgi:hypothetical protein